MKKVSLKPKTALNLIAAGVGFLFVLFTVVIIFQLVKIHSLKQQQAALLHKQQYLSSMVESYYNGDFDKMAEQYARDVLNWTKPGEIVYRPQTN